ncbi:hypothetical protein pb186bvf_016096 [Paramecium bursaria]
MLILCIGFIYFFLNLTFLLQRDVLNPFQRWLILNSLISKVNNRDLNPEVVLIIQCLRQILLVSHLEIRGFVRTFAWPKTTWVNMLVKILLQNPNRVRHKEYSYQRGLVVRSSFNKFKQIRNIPFMWTLNQKKIYLLLIRVYEGIMIQKNKSQKAKNCIDLDTIEQRIQNQNNNWIDLDPIN